MTWSIDVDKAPVRSQKLSLWQQSPLLLQRKQLMEHWIIQWYLNVFPCCKFTSSLNFLISTERSSQWRVYCHFAVFSDSTTCWSFNLICFITFTCNVFCLQKMEMFLFQFLLLKKQFVEARNVIFFISIFGYNRK